MAKQKQKIVPGLWFDGNAREAAEFYVSVFEDSKINQTTYYPTEGLDDFQKDLSGHELTVSFELHGYQFIGLNAGPEFKFNPSISFFLNFDPSRDEEAAENLEKYWDKLVEGGKVLIEIGEHPFSKQYGWVQDKFGVTWQLILTDPDGEERPFIVPSLMFTDESGNYAEEAANFYTGIFKNAKMGNVFRYPEAPLEFRKDGLAFGDFMLENQWFAAMDSGVKQDFTFNEAISFYVHCEDQAEIDNYFEKLSAVPESEQCGWVKDRFGVSWQIVPKNMIDLIANPDGSNNTKAFQAMMQMKKLDIAELEKSHEGK